MGIKDLNVFLDTTMTRPRLRQIPFNRFKGQYVAIDGHNWAYTNMAVANKVIAKSLNPSEGLQISREEVLRKWYRAVLDTVVLFMNHGVTPVFVFDGTYPPEKSQVHDKRRQEKLREKEMIDALQEELGNLSPLDYDDSKVEQLRKLLSRCGYIQKDEIESLKRLLEGIGIPVLKARGDAEELCSSLARVGMVSAVYSKDTDNLVYGCPILITSLEESYFDEEAFGYRRIASCVYLQDVLEELKLNPQQFTDLCIMCGCDFNQRISRLGPKTAFKIIKEYGSLDNLPSNYDLTPLNYQRCRQIFQSSFPYHEVTNGDIVPVKSTDLKLRRDDFFQYGETILSEYDSSTYVFSLHYLFSSLKEAAGKKVIKINRKVKSS